MFKRNKPSKWNDQVQDCFTLGAYIFYIRMKNELWETYGSIHIFWTLGCPFRLKFWKKLIMCLYFVCSLLSNHLFSLYLVITGRDILQKRGSVTINISFAICGAEPRTSKKSYESTILTKFISQVQWISQNSFQFWYWDGESRTTFYKTCKMKY